MPKDHSLTKQQKEYIKKKLKSFSTFEDKVWYYLHLTSRNYIISADFFSIDERNALESTEKIKTKTKSSVSNNLSPSEQEAMAVREMLGFPGEIGISKEDEKFTEELAEILRDEIYGDGTPESKKETYSKLAVIDMKINMCLAKEAEENKKLFDENDPYRDWKAMYVTNRALTEYGMMDQGLNEFYTSLVMPDYDVQKRLVITDEENLDFTDINKGIEEKLSPEDRKKYEIGKKARTDIKIPTVKVPGKEIPERDPVILKWLEESGNLLIQNLAKEKLIDGYQKFKTDLLDYNNSVFKDTDTIGTFYVDEMKNTNVMLLRAARDQLIDTLDKKNGKNAPLFEKIVKDMRSLDGLLSAQDSLKVHLLKETIGKECLQYIIGKEKVRKNDYGRDRVDAILAIMAEVLPEYTFKKEIERINTVRKAKPGDENYIDVADYKHHYLSSAKGDYSTGKIYQNWVSKGLKVEKEKQEKSREDRNYIPSTYQGLKSIEGLYGKKFNKSDKKLMAAFDGIGGSSKLKTFKTIEENFVAVGKYGTSDYELSDKDFAAIAYAGALTPEAAAKDPRFQDSEMSTKACFTGKKYTSGIGIDIDSDIKKYAEVIEFGRESAAEAMREYANGNKVPLAHLLSAGIKNICNSFKKSEKLYYDKIADTEMLSRMTDMMYRDPDLFVLAQKEGFSNDELRYAKSIRLATRALSSGMDSAKKLNESEKKKEKLPKNVRIKAVTDILVKRIIDESYNLNTRKLLRNPDYMKELSLIKEKYNKEIKPINDELAKNIVGKEYIERRAELFEKKDKLNEYLEYNTGILRAKYLPENKLMSNLSNRANYIKLKQDVAKVVENTGLYKCSVKELVKKIEDKKFAQNMKSIIDSNESKEKAPVNKNVQKVKEKQQAITPC